MPPGDYQPMKFTVTEKENIEMVWSVLAINRAAGRRRDKTF